MRIYVKAKPFAGKTEVVRLDEAHFEVSVTEPPVQGRANRAVVAALADYFNVASGRITIVSGFTSRQKIVDVR